MAQKRWGATPEEWELFSDTFQLTRDLLPVVSNPDRAISPNSHMKSLGKTPSAFNREGLVIGLVNWTERESTSQLVTKWKNDTDLGMCIQTRFLRAFDVDVKDAVLAASILAFLQNRHQFPIRFRADSAKFLVSFYLEGDFTKRVIKLSAEKKGPMVEFLAGGQQFVAAGTHSDGARYEWDWRGLAEPPTLTPEEFEEIYTELLTEFGTEEISASGARKARIAGAVTVDDDIAKFIETTPFFIGVDKGKVLMDCPWKDNHSTDNGDTQTTYMLAGERDYKKGHFKCLHAGCAQKKDNDFLDAIGYNDAMFEPLPEPVAVEGEPVVLELPPFDRIEKTGEIKATLRNLRLALERPDIAKAELRTDTFRDEVMYRPHKKKVAAWRPLKDADQVHMREWLETNEFKTVGRELMRDAILARADKHSFDSAIDWLNNTVSDWDGVPRIDTFFIDYMGVEDSDYTRAVARYLWTALAGRVLEPGVKADMVPILVGPQGYRKSSAIAALVPSMKLFVEIDLADRDDNLARMMRGKLIAEIPELKGLHSRDLESIKAFVARQFETWVPKYREFSTEYPRRLVFVGTTNQDEFLADTTGNRRWLPVIITRIIDTDAIKAMREQLWAEARALFIAGGIDWSAEKLAGEAHDKHTMTDAWEGEVLRWLDTADEVAGEGNETPRERGFFTLAQAFDGALNMLAKNCKRADEMRLAAVLRKLGCVKGKEHDVRGWLIGAKAESTMAYRSTLDYLKTTSKR